MVVGSFWLLIVWLAAGRLVGCEAVAEGGKSRLNMDPDLGPQAVKKLKKEAVLTCFVWQSALSGSWMREKEIKV
jgi:hypothetical protein